MEKVIGGIKRDCYPLTAAQMVHIFTLKYSPTQEIVNIGTGQYFQSKMNTAALREALNRGIERCESLRLRIWQDPDTGELWQYVMPYQNQYFEYYDFSAWEEEKAHEVMAKWTSQPFDTYREALFRIVLVSLPGGYSGYYLNVHHVCMDSSSVIAFSKDVMAIYCYLMYNMPYPKPMASYIESVKQDLEYEGSKKAKRDEAYWHQKLTLPEPMYTDFSGPGKLQRQRQKNGNPEQRWCDLSTVNAAGNTITYDLDVASTNKLIDFAKEHDIPVSVIILHAIRTVLSKFNKDETDIPIRNFVSRRSTLLHKKCGGVRMHCLPLRTIVPLDATVLESMRIIHQEQQQMFLHSDYPTLKFYAEERAAYGCPPGATYHSVSFTYQPDSMASMAPYVKGAAFKSRWYSSGRQPMPMYVTAMHRPGDGGLTFYFGYQTEIATPPEIEFLYYFTGRILFRSIENPNKTVLEIIDMT